MFDIGRLERIEELESLSVSFDKNERRTINTEIIFI